MILDQARIDHEAKVGNWPNRILTDYFAETLRTNPQKTVLIAHRNDTNTETILSYADLDRYVTVIARNLAAHGIAKSDIVSFQLPNWWQFIAIHLACLRIGAISNPLMPIFRIRELEYMVGFAESKVLIVPKVFQKFDHEALGNQLKQTIPSLEHVFVVGGNGANSFETALLKDRTDQTPFPTSLSPNDVVQILYTSGTTGHPKGVMHTSNTLLASANQVAERLRLDSSDIAFMPAPFAHQIGFCFGMVMPITLGIPIVIMDVWKPDIAAELIARHRASYTCASTPFMADLANVKHLSELDLDCFRMFMTAGAPVIAPIVEKVTCALKVNVVPGWGMTEVIQATATQPIASLSEPLTDGAAFFGNEVRIVDECGNELPPGHEGNLQCRGSTLFVGYHKSASYTTSIKTVGLIPVIWHGWTNRETSGLSGASRISSSEAVKTFPCTRSRLLSA